MSGREWKPGDVAMVTLTAPHPRRGTGPFLMLRDVSGVKDVWRLASTGVVHEDHETANVRPLVTIDPEDREQVEALRDALWKGGHLDIWQDRLREFANPTPPKPDEPTGLGAVVEDAEGNTYTRVDKGTLPWFTTHAGGNAGRCDWTRWDHIAAVRVLSEGVTP